MLIKAGFSNSVSLSSQIMRSNSDFSRIYLAIVIVLFVSTVLSYTADAQVMFLMGKDKLTAWHYAGGDEFNASSVDTTKWQSSYPWGQNLYCNKEQQFYTAFENVELQNGKLSLIARREQVKRRTVSYEEDNHRLVCNGVDMGVNLQTFDFTSGMIFSKNKFHYGYYEIRFMSDNGTGLWPAFWLYAGHENDEIDVFELKGEKNNQVHVDVHCKQGCKNYKTTLGLLRKNWGTFLTSSAFWHEGFNVMAIDWQPGFIKWYLNGNGIAYWKGNLSYPAWMIANVAIPSDNGPFGPGPDAGTPFPARLVIDYIRIWSPAKADENPLLPLELNKPVLSESYGNATLAKRRRPEFKRKPLKEQFQFLLLGTTGDGFYQLELPGELQGRFMIEVLNKNDNLVYSSTNGSQLVHRFPADKGATLRIQSGIRFIEYPLP